MNTREESISAWRCVRRELEKNGGKVVVSKAHIPHPRNAGAHVTTTIPVGQIFDFALDEGGVSMAIREFENRFEAFFGPLQLTQAVLDLMVRNPGTARYVGATAIGAGLGAALTRKREGMYLGAALGLLIAGLLAARDDATGNRS